MQQKFSLPLVNTHTHAAMVAFRGMAEDLPLQKWLEEYIWPAEKQNVTTDFVYAKTKQAILEMQKNGIKIFCDMYFFEEEVARAAKELGMSVMIGEGILDFPTPSAKTPTEAFEITEKLLVRYADDPRVLVAVAPHSIYAVCEKNLIRAKKLAEKYSAPLHIHLAETKTEFDECLEKNNLTPIAYLDKLGLLGERTILAHCVWVTDADIKIMAERKVNVAHCPLSNLKLGSGIAPIIKMLESGINVCLGTDGAASSNRLDIWEAGKFAALLQKGTSLDSSKISTKDVVKMMTINGLKALGYAEFEGKEVVDMEKEIEEAENYNFLYALNSEEVDFE
ncbi:MAG: amidohydrolase [Candidatus Moranbacteria bacterium]|nr:amidohydrolase [Candidatus Moranbacteria bacterium]